MADDSAEHGAARTGTAAAAAASSFSFPAAAQPSIIRAYQKDGYYQALFRASLADTARALLGARFLATHAEHLSLLAGLGYWVLAAGGGGQTLGEEYVNAIMVESGSGRIASRRRRLLFVVLLALVPTLLSRGYAQLRRYAQKRAAALAQARERARLRAAALARSSSSSSSSSSQLGPRRSRTEAVYSFLARRLPSLESLHAGDGVFAYLGAAHLALFYLGGRYYALAQRAARVQYISTIPPHPNATPPSYEILGVLLAVQLSVKMLLALRTRLRQSQEREREREEAEAEAAGWELDEKGDRHPSKQAGQRDDEGEGRTVKIDSHVWTHDTAPASLVKARPRRREAAAEGREEDDEAPIVPLLYPSPDGDGVTLYPSASAPTSTPPPRRTQAETAQIAQRTAHLAQTADALLRCTLCMETRTPERGNSAVTECGHVFCWECITGWAREKPECPLCRQSLAPSRLLPVYNF